MPKILKAPNGENAKLADSDAFPSTGSQDTLLSSVLAYIRASGISDSDILFTDITDGDADSDQHGFLPKLSGDSDT